MKSVYKRIILIGAVILLLLTAAYSGYRVHILSGDQEVLKEDYSTVNNITFGLLSVNTWRDEIMAAATNRIENFQLSTAQEDSLKVEIKKILQALIDKADSMMHAPKKGLGEKIKKAAMNLFIDLDKLREQVPSFASDIMAEIKKPRSKQRLAFLAKDKLKELGQETYDSSLQTETRITDSLFRKYEVTDKAGFENKVRHNLQQVQQQTYTWSYAMLGTVLVMLGLWWWLRKDQPFYTLLYISSIALAVILLLVGLTTTMIEIDARIQSLDFRLVGETISFRNQVLFFQSKSIIDVVGILIKTGKVDSIFVGVLILCFSILFPFAKLFSTGIYLLGKKDWTKNKSIRYFAFKSGKWSMADVMVVAIFMAYIGFNGVLDDQLSDLNMQNETLTSITTNHTSLQPGYIVFVGFVVYGLILSLILKKITGHKTP